VGGVTCSDGSRLEADQRLDGGPSVLYDAVVVAVSADGIERLRDAPAARDFVSDAFAHCKFIGYSSAAQALFAATGLSDKIDGGCQELAGDDDVDGFLTTCAALRYWPRQATLP
jgi:catalase